MNLLNKPKNILDIGANIGVMTVHLAERFPGATIHAVEPLKPNLDALKYSLSKRNLNNFRIYETALGDQICNLEMVMPEDGNTRLHGLSHVVHESIDQWNKGTIYQVPCTTLDHLFPNLEVQGIKIDVENFEFFVLKGAQQLISRCHPLIYAELWDNENRSNCFDLMKSYNYKILCVSNDQIVEWDPEIETQNFIFQ